MTRLLLATCLLLFASSAFAKSPAPATDPADGSAKPGKVVATANDADPNAPHPAVAPPARSAPLPTRGGAPRWHSLLPGMIR
jgi:hypothetical protein